jgi:hypothetical protein
MKAYGWGNAPHSADQYSEAIGLARQWKSEPNVNFSVAALGPRAKR